MPSIRPAGPYPIQGINIETWLVRFDKNGVCSSPKTRAALLDALAAKQDAPVLFFSHGWNNDFADSVQLYQNFLIQFEQVVHAHPLPGPKPIFVGITWPSIWLPSDSGPQMAGTESNLDQMSEVEGVVRELLQVLPKNTNWPRLYELLEAMQLSEPETRELAKLLKPALQPSEDGPQEADASEDNIIAALSALQNAQGGAPPSNNLDDIGTVAGTGGAGAPATASLPAFLDPRWAVRLASLYLMKDRAGTVGHTGVSELMRDMLRRTNGPIHAIGHSFGGKVMLSALATQAPDGRRVQSLLLLQPAVSHLSFAKTVPGRAGPGGYRCVLDRVVNPIFSTYSSCDFPLSTIYHRALLRRSDLGELQIAAVPTTAGNPPSPYAALGGYGPRGVDEGLIDPIPAPGVDINTTGRRVVGLDGSQFKRIGSHGGVANPFTAWALYKLMTL